MRFAFFLLMLFIFKISLSAAEIDIRQFSGSINGDYGNGKATYFVLPLKLESPTITNFEFERSDLYFTARVGSESFDFELPTMMSKAHELSFQNFTMKESASSLNTSVQSIQIVNIDKSKSNFSKMNFKCSGLPSLENDFKLQLLRSCPLNSTLTIEDITGATELKEFSLSLKNNKLNFSTKLNQGFWVTAKGEGTTQFSESDSILTIKINMVTAVGMNVTDKLFTVLEKINDPTIVVANPFIYIHFAE